MLVGIDGSEGSARALRWALARTDQFGPVQPLLAWQYPWWAYSTPFPPPAGDFRKQAEAMADRAVEGVPVDRCRPPIVTRGDAGPTLVEVGATEPLIVVGTRGRGALADRLLGSVSGHVVAHSTVPVAVVPTPPDPAPGSESRTETGSEPARVVVGVDGSVNSMTALSWAVKHHPPDTVIEVVHCWSYPAGSLPDGGMPACHWYEEAARDNLRNSVAAVARGTGTGGHRLVSKLEYGDPRWALAEVAMGAEALVLGSRGRTGLAHLLLGSVTSALIHQPEVPVLVIPGSDRAISE